jgi:chemotaxis protein methyltransferase CheR
MSSAAGGSAEISDREFDRVRALLKQRTGIHLTDVKRRLVITRLAPRVRHTKAKTFSEYLDLVETEGHDEAEQFLNALTTNVTHFFREQHHFNLLRERLFHTLEQRPATRGRLRFWCAACSTGEEPYSLAIALLESGLPQSGLDVRILATDIDSRVLAHAQQGVYQRERVEKVPADVLRRYFWRGAGARAGHVRVKPKVSQLVHFKRLNLFDPWPMSGPFDVVFCRNVFIYFEPEARDALTRRFHEILGPTGYLFLGHSESITGAAASLFQPLGHTVFLKRGRNEGASRGVVQLPT